MKTILISVLVGLISFTKLTAQDNVAAENRNINAFIRVWGVLKYHHPVSVSGNFDADQSFLSFIATIKDADATSFNMRLMSLFISLKAATHGQSAIAFDTQKARLKDDKVMAAQLLQNINMKWIHQRIYSPAVQQELSWITQVRNLSGQHYYIPELNYTADIPHEKPYADYQFDQESLNLLTLAKAWNAIEYLFPHKYIIGKDWAEVLQEMVPVFRKIHDRITYERAVLLLEVAINDTHAEGFVSQMKEKVAVLKWNYYPPFDYQVYGQNILIKNFLNDSLATDSQLKKGDLITRINGVSVRQLLKSRYSWHPASNYAVKNRSVSTSEDGAADFFSALSDKSLKLQVQRKDKVIKITMELLEGEEAMRVANFYLRSKFKKEQQRKGYEELDEQTVLFRAGYYFDKDLPHGEAELNAFSDNLKSKSAIIFDMRGYPEAPGLFYYFIPKALGIPAIKFARYYAADLTYPGAFVYKPEMELYMSSDLKADPNPYHGKIIILTDENTQSMGEWYTLMLSRLNKNTVIIGSQTAGTDGDIKRLNLPGGYKFVFTGNAIFDLNGERTQRIGIKPDIKFNPSAADLVFRNDALMEKALEYLSEKK